MSELWAVTGHRPNKLGGYSTAVFDKLVQLAGSRLDYLLPGQVITGMALGWDQAVALACIQRNIPFTAAVPCKGQERRWPHEAQLMYRELISQALEVHILAEFYTPAVMYARNRWMVDRAPNLLALWNGDISGGTYQCYKYAEIKQRHIINCWPNWSTMQP